MLALLLALVTPAQAADKVEPIRVTVRPAIGFAPGDIHAIVFIERDARNRSLTITLDGDRFLQESGPFDVDGAQRQRVWERWWLGLPCGDYEVRAELRRLEDGKAQVLRAKGRAELRGFECPGLTEAGQ